MSFVLAANEQSGWHHSLFYTLGKFPNVDRATFTDRNDVSREGADANTFDWGAVTNTDVSNVALVIQPELKKERNR